MDFYIDGLQYFPDFLTETEQEQLLNYIDSATWLDDLSRRVQHYGFKYDYKKKSIDRSMNIGELPEWVQPIIQKINELDGVKFIPDQVIINEYIPGQGIAAHIDCKPCFEDLIVSISLGSGCNMDFKKGDEEHSVYLEPGSIVLLEREARYFWTHGIKARKSDVATNGVKRERGRRVSVTLRKVILETDFDS